MSPDVYDALRSGAVVAIGVPLKSGQAGFSKWDVVAVREKIPGASERYVVGVTAVGAR